MQIGVIGINHKLASVHLREIIALLFQKHFGIASTLGQTGSYVLLSTCNRSEIYFSTPDPASTHQAILGVLRSDSNEDMEQKLYTFFGLDCFLHLARVTSGLDSASILETEIQGQVKQAYETFSNQRFLPKELHFLFQKALQVSKELRASFFKHKPTCDLEQVLFQTAKEFFGKKENPKVLFIGVSDINKKIARFLQPKGFTEITFCNRSCQPTTHISQELECKILPWDRLHTSFCSYNWIISATKSTNLLLTKNLLDKNNSSFFLDYKLLTDLSVPRNIDRSYGRGNWKLLDIDDLNALLETGKEQLKTTVLDAEKCLYLAVERKIEQFNKQKIGSL